MYPMKNTPRINNISLYFKNFKNGGSFSILIFDSVFSCATLLVKKTETYNIIPKTKKGKGYPPIL